MLPKNLEVGSKVFLITYQGWNNERVYNPGFVQRVLKTKYVVQVELNAQEQLLEISRKTGRILGKNVGYLGRLSPDLVEMNGMTIVEAEITAQSVKNKSKRAEMKRRLEALALREWPAIELGTQNVASTKTKLEIVEEKMNELYELLGVKNNVK